MNGEKWAQKGKMQDGLDLEDLVSGPMQVLAIPVCDVRGGGVVLAVLLQMARVRDIIVHNEDCK